MNADRQLSGWLAAALFIVLIAIASLVGANLLSDPEALRDDVESWGAAGVAVALALVLVHAVLPFPAELLGLATGYAYGFVPALALMLVLWTVSCLFAYWLSRRYGRRLAGRFVDAAALDRTEARIAGTGAGMLLALRVIPIVPYNLVSYACGMFGVPLSRFTWTTFVGLAPQLAFVTYAGSEAVELSPTDWRIWTVGLGWLALIVVGRWIAQRIGPERPEAT